MFIGWHWITAHTLGKLAPTDFIFSIFHSCKDSDGLPLTHNSTEETPQDRTPPHHLASYMESPPSFLETAQMRGQDRVGMPCRWGEVEGTSSDTNQTKPTALGSHGESSFWGGMEKPQANTAMDRRLDNDLGIHPSAGSGVPFS